VCAENVIRIDLVNESLVANCEWSKIMVARRLLLLSPKTRQRIAKHAATIRWRDVKAAEGRALKSVCTSD